MSQLGFTYKNEKTDDSAVSGDLQLTNQEIIFLGLENGGKTSIVRRLDGEDDVTLEIQPTKGYSFRYINYKDVYYTVWDVGGNKNCIETYWSELIENKHGLVWVIDSGNQPKLDSSRQELVKQLHNKPESLKSLQILCNKQDQPEHDRMSLEYIEGFLNQDYLGYTDQELSWSIKGCSAVEDFGIDEHMKALVVNMKFKKE